MRSSPETCDHPKDRVVVDQFALLPGVKRSRSGAHWCLACETCVEKQPDGSYVLGSFSKAEAK